MRRPSDKTNAKFKPMQCQARQAIGGVPGAGLVQPPNAMKPQGQGKGPLDDGSATQDIDMTTGRPAMVSMKRRKAKAAAYEAGRLAARESLGCNGMAAAFATLRHVFDQECTKVIPLPDAQRQGKGPLDHGSQGQGQGQGPLDHGSITQYMTCP